MRHNKDMRLHPFVTVSVWTVQEKEAYRGRFVFSIGHVGHQRTAAYYESRWALKTQEGAWKKQRREALRTLITIRDQLNVAISLLEEAEQRDPEKGGGVIITGKGELL